MIKRTVEVPVVLCLLVSIVCATDVTTVSRVIDGDTLETSEGRRVRLIGINAPEIQDLFGPEAKQHLSSLVEGRQVELIPDKRSSDHDRYQRLLRYVVLDGTDINKQMVDDGFATAYLKYHFERSNEYLESEKKARTIGAGTWARVDQETGQKQSSGSSGYRSVRLYMIAGLVFLFILVGTYFYIRK